MLGWPVTSKSLILLCRNQPRVKASRAYTVYACSPRVCVKISRMSSFSVSQQIPLKYPSAVPGGCSFLSLSLSLFCRGGAEASLVKSGNQVECGYSGSD